MPPPSFDRQQFRPSGLAAAPALPLGSPLMEEWGLEHDAAKNTLRVAYGGNERSARLGPVRAGRSVLTCEVRVHPTTATLRVALTFGPGIRLEAAPPAGFEPLTAEVDGIVLGRIAVALELSGEHEIIWRR